LKEVVATAMDESQANAKQKSDACKSRTLASYLDKGERVVTFIKKDVPNSIEVFDR